MTYRFKIHGNFKAPHPFPIYDLLGPLAGSGVVDDIGSINCFVGHNEFPAALEISSGQKFFFIPHLENGYITKAFVSIVRQPNCIEVRDVTTT